MTPRLPSLLLAAVCALCAIALGVASRDATRLQQAENAGGTGQYLKSLHLAGEVRHEPSLTRAYAVRAYASEGLGDFTDARRWFSLAIRKSPSDWRLYRDAALPEFLVGHLAAAKHRLAVARRLNPLMPKPPRPGG